MQRTLIVIALCAGVSACAPALELSSSSAPGPASEAAMSTTESSAPRPPLDLRAPADTRTATFALG